MKYIKSFKESIETKLYHLVFGLESSIEWKENHIKLTRVDNSMFNRLKNKYTNVKLVGEFPNNFIKIDNYKIGEISIEFYDDNWSMVSIQNEVYSDSWTELIYVCDDEGIFELLDDLNTLCEDKSLCLYLRELQRGSLIKLPELAKKLELYWYDALYHTD